MMMGYKAKEHTLETFTLSYENPDFMKRVGVFCDASDQLLAKDILNWSYKTKQEGYRERLEIRIGKRFIKLIKCEGKFDERQSLFGWIDMSNGDVLMGHSYKSPSASEKRNPRSNIWNDHFGVDCVSTYGVGYKGAKYDNSEFIAKAVDNQGYGNTIKETITNQWRLI